MIENTQDMRAYHFMKNIDTGDHDLLIRFTTVQRNYPIGSVDLNRNHSSDVLV